MIYKNTLRFLLFFLISLSSFAEVSPLELSKEAIKKLSQVPEFDFIQKKATEMGVKVYLFGGSAAAYAHYVRWDLERLSGDTKHQPERFDYDFTNIYRGNQDLDLVVDGTEKQALELRALLQKEYPHFVGDKQSWEVRLLRSSMGDKLPLLDDPDFKNQHTDTNSTGMLDLTAVENESAFRDLLDWNNRESRFLKDVTAARITYLFNDNHEDTTRFKEGKNPPIFSAVRYLAKLTQYEVKGTPEDLAIIQKIIDETEFAKLSNYVKNKLGEFAQKVLLNSPNSEYAWNLMDELGLRKKLIEMDGKQIKSIDSLSWWLNKEPLRSQEFGTEGKTAFEIFGEEEIILSHETNSFQAYENITRSSRGEANAFISRNQVNGETAAYGDGFYTKKGFTGARGTGLTIRFKLHPDAREGADFTVHHDFIVIKNKKALTLIQENTNISLSDFLVLFRNIKNSEKGLIEKFTRKFERIPTYSEEFQAAVRFVEMHFDLSSYSNKLSPYKVPLPLNSVGNLLHIFKHEIYFYYKKIIDQLLSDPSFKWSQNFDLLERFIFISNTEDSDTSFDVINKLVSHILKDDSWTSFTSEITELFRKYTLFQSIFIGSVLSNLTPEREKFITSLIKSSLLTDLLPLAHFLERTGHQNQEWFEYILYTSSNKTTDSTLLSIINTYMNNEKQKKKPSRFHIALYEKWVEIILNRKLADGAFAEHILTNPHWHDKIDWLKTLIDRKNADAEIARYVLPQQNWLSLIDLSHEASELPSQFSFYVTHASLEERGPLERIFFRNTDTEITSHILASALDHPDFKSADRFLQKALIFFGNYDNGSFPHLKAFTQYAQNNPSPLAAQFMKKIISNFTPERKTLRELLGINTFDTLLKKTTTTPWTGIKKSSRFKLNSSPYQVISALSFENFGFAKKEDKLGLLHRGFFGTYDYFVLQALKNPEWTKYPEVLESLIEKDTVNEFIITEVLTYSEWGQHTRLVLKLFEFGKYDKLIMENLLTAEHWAQPELLEAYFKKYHLSTRAGSFGKTILHPIRSSMDKFYATKVLSKEHWTKHPEYVIQMIKRGVSDWEIQHWIFSDNSHWENHPILQVYTNRHTVTVKDIKRQLKRVNFDYWYKDYLQKIPPPTCQEVLK